MQFFINKMIISTSTAASVTMSFQRVLNDLCGQKVALSFYDDTGLGRISEPGPSNVTIERVDKDNNKLYISVPLDLVYGVDTELY